MTLDKCFVIMPFSGMQGSPRDTAYWTRFYKDYIKKSVNELGMNCERSTASARSIVGGIVGDLYESRIVVAVLTDHNPNVFYELGARHALSRGTIMMIEHDQKIPFDLQDFGVIHYERRNRSQFKKDLSRMLDDISSRVVPDNPIAGFMFGHTSSHVRIANDVQNSDLNTDAALHVATEDMLVVGQNLFNLANNNVRDRIFANLDSKPNLVIRIMYADSRDKRLVAALNQIVDGTVSQYLDKTDSVFKEWLKTWRIKRPYDQGRLLIHRSRNMGNISATLVDGESPSGCIMIRPVLYYSQPRSRPTHWLRRFESPSVYDSYLSAFSQIWSQSEPLA